MTECISSRRRSLLLFAIAALLGWPQRDVGAAMIYWIEGSPYTSTGRILRAHLDGTQRELVYAAPPSQFMPYQIAADPFTRDLFARDSIRRQIVHIGPDGQLDSVINSYSSFALDAINRKLLPFTGSNPGKHGLF